PHATAARHDFIGRSLASECFEGTQVDLIRDINGWAKSNDPCIFWVSGLAGVGKSTVAQTVAKDYTARGWLGASFFFNRQNPACSDPDIIFTTIAYQLAQNSSFRSAIADAVESKKNSLQLPIQDQLDSFIISPLQTITYP